MLSDLLENGLSLVICGTAVGKRSAERAEYYAGSGNKFWTVLKDVGLTDELLKPGDYQQLLKYHIGLTDVVKNQSGMDRSIDMRHVTPKKLCEMLERYRPRILCFNGKTAARLFLGERKVDYGPLSYGIGSMRLFVAPSTSGAANRWWDIRWWEKLAILVNSQSQCR